MDPEGKANTMLSPDVVIDAIMAKRNLGTRKTEAGFVIGVGPDFVAPRDVHAVIEATGGTISGVFSMTEARSLIPVCRER